MRRQLLMLILLVLLPGLSLVAQQVPGTAPEGSMKRAVLQASDEGPVMAAAATGLSLIYSATGNYYLSADAVGSGANSMTVDIHKPSAAAMVHKAYLFSATTSGVLSPGCVTLTGTPIVWDGSVNHTPPLLSFNNYYADVTALISAKIDPLSSAGVYPVEVTECSSGITEGEALLVIFMDPAQEEKTVAILWGALSTTGDNFNLTLADPIDPMDPASILDMGLGIAYGYQPTAQFSQIDVNGARLTTSAGGQDDGAAANGALITVGGLGDTNANPADPYANGMAGPFYDDELYNLLPFTTSTTTSINVNTLNPSNDDNVFLAYFVITGEAVVVTDCTNPPVITMDPADAIACVGETVTFTVEATGDDLTYKWIRLSDDAVVSTGPTLVISPVTVADAVNYKVEVDSEDCDPDVSPEFSLMVPEVMVDPTTQQYSDLVDFQAVIHNGAALASTITEVEFFIGMQEMASTMDITTSGVDLLAEAQDVPLLETVDGELAPGVKVVSAVFKDVTEMVVGCSPVTELTIEPETACATYAGVYYASTGSVNATTATVVLAATIVQDDDGNPGDITEALVEFWKDGSLLATVPAQLLVDEIGDGPAAGSASYEWTGVNVGTYDITVKIVGYYTNSDAPDCNGQAVVTVGVPGGEFITGGGYVILEHPMGLAAGDVGSKNNFGFNVKYNKKMTNLQGHINTIIRRTETDGLHLYQVKGNVMTSLTVKDNTAVFTGQASIQDVTDPENPVAVPGGGGATMQFSMTDNGEPGTEDMISITVWKKDGGLWFSTFWASNKPAEQQIDGGNLVVHSGGGGGKPARKSATIEGFGEEGFRVYPNPFTDRIQFEFTPETDGDARLELFDLTGRLVSTLLNERVQSGVSYRKEFVPASSSDGLFFYRMTFGDAVETGKLMRK